MLQKHMFLYRRLANSSLLIAEKNEKENVFEFLALTFDLI